MRGKCWCRLGGENRMMEEGGEEGRICSKGIGGMGGSDLECIWSIDRIHFALGGPATSCPCQSHLQQNLTFAGHCASNAPAPTCTISNRQTIKRATLNQSGFFHLLTQG